MAGVRRGSQSARSPLRRIDSLKVREFLDGAAELARPLLPPELRDFQHRLQGSLVKLYYDDPGQHYEVWLRRSAGLVELGLHFETREPRRNAELLEWFVDELPLIKAALGEQTEAEPWDRGWARIHRVMSLEPLEPEFQQRLADHLAETIEVLEPLRREATAVST